MTISKQNSKILQPFVKGDKITAAKLNQSILAINSLFSGSDSAKNLSNAGSVPQLYIATEKKGKWTSSGTKTNTTVKCRPIRMSLYTQDGTNDYVKGAEVELAKFWDQKVNIDDFGIAVNMGSGRQSFYAIKSNPYIKIKNVSGGAIVAGDCLYVDTATLTTGVYQITASQVSAEYHERFAVFATDDVANNAIGEFAFIGDVFANVNVTDVGHKYAFVVKNTYKMKSTPYPTRFRMLKSDGTGTSLCQLLVTAPNYHWHSLKTSGVFALIDSKRVLTCTAPDSSTVYAMACPVVDPNTWDGVAIGGITYTRLTDTTRTANDGVNPTWTETLFPLYTTNEIISVLPNDYDVSSDRLVPYKETGNGKVWVKTCT